MNPNKALWEKGDFTRIAETMRESGEALVEKFGITKGFQVLDLGCGDGTTAIPQAKRRTACHLRRFTFFNPLMWRARQI
jgi:cyclopropane fatty-acyl-phospholipid synthase-like methyltransferase